VLVLLIAVALVVGIANQLLPMVERNPARIAAWLSERVGEPVRFTSARAEWTRAGPRFIFQGLRVGTGADTLVVGRAQLQVAMYSGLLPDHPLTELRIRDLALGLVQDPDRRWRVVGLPGQDATVDPLDRLEGFGELRIERARLSIRAPLLSLSADLPRVDARIRVNQARVRVGVSGWSDTADRPLDAVLDMDRRTGSGLLWVGGSDLRLAHWHGFFASVGLVPQQGHAEVGVWARVHDRRVDRVTLQADVREAVLRPVAPLQVGETTRALRVGLERVDVLARWDTTATGWRLSVPRLQVTQAGKVARLDQLRVEGGRHLLLHGDDLDLSPLAALLSLSDRLSPRLRLFLAQSNPQARLQRLYVEGWRDGPLRGKASVSGLALQPFAQRPGVSGLSGQLEFDERGGVLQLAPSPVHLRWPGGLRQPLDLRVDGTLALWRDGRGWTLGTHGLRVVGDDLGIAARLQLGFQGDGSKPTLDVAANLDPSSVATAKKLWLLHRMSPKTIAWLDRALVAGTVSQGRVAIGGDLDDWPFRGTDGAFDARAHLGDTTLQFTRDWPAGQHMDADLVFDGPGFALAGTGVLLGNPIGSVRGGIARFSEGLLRLDVASTTRGEALRALLLASPLQKDYGEHLRNAQVTGPAQVAVGLQIPLHPDGGENVIAGTLDLAGGTLADPRWDVAFDRVSGRTRFDRKGFATENLAVHFAGQPATFNLRVGAQTGDGATAALASLDGRLSAASLLAGRNELAWLKPWLSGTSQWRIGVRVPASPPGRRAPPAQLSAASDLVGTALLLPAPLHKAEAAPLGLELQAPLPIEAGEVALRLGSLMRLRAQAHANGPLGGAIAFGDAALPPLPARDLSVRGNVPVLDAFGWVAFANAEPAGTSAAAPVPSAGLRDADVQAQQLLFLDRNFADARVQFSRVPSGTQVRLAGTGIGGTINIPTETGGAVQGRFDTLYLASDPPGKPGPAAAGAGAPAPPAESDAPGAAAVAGSGSAEVEDPGKLPPMHFEIADLRLGQAQLGKASLQTTPIPGGMRIDRFRTQATDFTLDAAGEWVRAAKGTRSNFKLDFGARSLGQMLDALGYKDMVKKGSTKATLTGSWPGSPGAFGLSNLSGSLHAEVGEGQLLSVEPGGSGRMLGLISLAEIPRRLTLDFSDFFEKGFSFNTAKGDFIFSDGKARTDNLVIDGPAAEVRVSGSTGMREQVYDQRVEVLPKAGGVLPAIGLVLGGPVGAAAGAMAQAVLSKPLKQTTRVLYRITGPWTKPVVKVIEKGPRRSGASTARSDSPATGGSGAD
jgi:uncharacterized protein (TIGR02099 family)